VLSGLPPVVRGGDELDQKITLRNDSDRAMTVRVRAEESAGAPARGQRIVTLPAHQSQAVSWRVRVPVDVDRIDWRISARADQVDESDALPNQIDLIVQATESEQLKQLVPLAVETAIRRSELLNIQWQNIDFDRRSIYRFVYALTLAANLVDAYLDWLQAGCGRCTEFLDSLAQDVQCRLQE